MLTAVPRAGPRAAAEQLRRRARTGCSTASRSASAVTSMRRGRSSSPRRSAASRSIRPRMATRWRGRSRCWPPTSRPYPPIPAVVEAITKALTGLNRYPDPTNAALRRRLGEVHGVPANRIAIGNGSCDILLAAGDALLEPGAELVYAWPSFSRLPAPGGGVGRARDRGAGATADHRHDLARMREEITGGDAARDRLQPEQPDLDGAAAGRDRRLRRERPAPRRGDPRRGLHRVQRPAGPGRLGRPARQAPQPRPAADVQQGLRAVRAARRLRAVRVGVLPHRRRPGAPAVLLQRGRAGGGAGVARTTPTR